MGFYAKHILPWAVNRACSAKPNRRQREKVVPLAEGRVLEVGVGSGLNFPHYDRERVVSVVAVDPSAEMLRMAESTVAGAPVDVDLVQAGAEDLPVESSSIDTVLVTYTLCTIPDVFPALAEMARVLAPGGRLLFCEHGLAPDASVAWWQRKLNPAWRAVGGGCNLGRNIPDLIRRGGFRITGMETMYLPGWKPASFNYRGIAVPTQGTALDDPGRPAPRDPPYPSTPVAIPVTTQAPGATGGPGFGNAWGGGVSGMTMGGPGSVLSRMSGGPGFGNAMSAPASVENETFGGPGSGRIGFGG